MYTARKATDAKEEPRILSSSSCSITVIMKTSQSTFATVNTNRHVSRSSPSLSPNSPRWLKKDNSSNDVFLRLNNRGKYVKISHKKMSKIIKIPTTLVKSSLFWQQTDVPQFRPKFILFSSICIVRFQLTNWFCHYCFTGLTNPSLSWKKRTHILNKKKENRDSKISLIQKVL